MKKPPALPQAKQPQRIAAACAKLVDLLTRQPAAQPAPIAAPSVSQPDRRPQSDERPV